MVTGRARATLSKLWVMLRRIAWCTLGAWTALAIFFSMPPPVWLDAGAALAVGSLFVLALAEHAQFRQWIREPMAARPRTTSALLASIILAVYYFGFVSPDPNQKWAVDHARIPEVTIDGPRVHVHNVRDFRWRSATDFTPEYRDRIYDADTLDSMYYVVAPMSARLQAVAHVFVCFGFSDGQYVAVSVEGRRIEDRPYRAIPSMFRQYQLIYIIGEERDVVGLRGAIWRTPVHFYPARTSVERQRAIFLDMMRRADSLEHHPEFYHLITNNCMNNITAHIRRLGGRTLPHDLTLLLTGLSDRVAYNLGYIDTDLPFEQARQAYRVDLWMQHTALDEGFSQRLRQALARQVAQATADSLRPATDSN
jgi:hypothetical protein